MKDREFYKSLRALMVPIAFQSFMLAAVSAGDSAMLGLVDENDMAAANAVAGIVRQLAISVCRGLASGGEILLAGVLGSGDMVRGREYGRWLAVLSVLCGAVCAGLALPPSGGTVPRWPCTSFSAWMRPSRFRGCMRTTESTGG